MVRTEDERAQALRGLGAEVVVGNLLDLDSMHRVIAGCETMYFGMSVSDAYLAGDGHAAAVAKHYGREGVHQYVADDRLQMSITKHSESAAQAALARRAGAEIGQVCRLCTCGRQCFSKASFLTLTPDSVRESDQIRLPFGEGKTSPVARKTLRG